MNAIAVYFKSDLSDSWLLTKNIYRVGIFNLNAGALILCNVFVDSFLPAAVE